MSNKTLKAGSKKYTLLLPAGKVLGSDKTNTVLSLKCCHEANKCESSIFGPVIWATVSFAGSGKITKKYAHNK